MTERLQNILAPRGSDLYYATRKMPEAAREQLLSVFALKNEITNVIDACSDHGVARLKLQWWGDQINKMYASDAEHPAVINFSKVCASHNVPQELMQGLVYGQLYLLDNPQCDSIEAQLMMCQHTEGVVAQ